MGFKAISKMKTTKPSVDEVGSGMKKGSMPMVMKDGKKIPAFAAKKGGMPKMNMGGAMMPDAYNPSMAMKSGGKTKKMAMGGGAMMANPRITGATAPALAAQMAQQQGRAALMQPRAIARPNPGVPVMAAARKKGGEVESKAMQMKEERQIKGIKKELMSHEGKPASKAHKGLNTGGVIQKYATGGVIQKYATGGVIQKYAEGGHAKMMCEGGSGHKAMKKGGSF